MSGGTVDNFTDNLCAKLSTVTPHANSLCPELAVEIAPLIHPAVLPSGENAMSMTRLVWPSSICSGAPVTASHSLAVLSLDADATSLRSGEVTTAMTGSEWPSSVCSGAPVDGSQGLTVLSQDADANSLMSGENAMALTECIWPSSVCSEELQTSCVFGS